MNKLQKEREYLLCWIGAWRVFSRMFVELQSCSDGSRRERSHVNDWVYESMTQSMSVKERKGNYGMSLRFVAW